MPCDCTWFKDAIQNARACEGFCNDNVKSRTLRRMTYTHNPTVVITDLEDELVLLNPQAKQLFSLNAVGRLLWLALPAGLDAAIARIVREFDVAETQARSDAEILITTLTNKGLLEVK
jgi:Coenzyme PQQ synthesis protein D (PqqD)